MEEEAEAPETQEARIIDAFATLIGHEGPLMVTSWVAMVEYIDEEGCARLGAYSSEMPPWRMSGIIEAGQEMLADEFLYEDEFEEYEEDE